jgi:hypothetical protein
MIEPDVLDAPPRYVFTLEPIVAMTEDTWIREAASALQTLGRCRTAALAHARELYQIYVVEKGFCDIDYGQDPHAAAVDDYHHSQVPPRRRVTDQGPPARKAMTA